MFWRRPTLARPIAVLPSGLQRFTAVFGMGTGGATALLSPECGTALAVSLLSQRRKREAESLETAADTAALQLIVDLVTDDSSDGHRPPLQFSKELLVL